MSTVNVLGSDPITEHVSKYQTGVAMPTDEDDQDGHFFYNHPERGAYFAA